MPAPAKSLFAKEKLRAFASEHGISSISVAGGNLTIEGIALDRDQLIPLKRKGARYLADKKKLIANVRKLGSIDLGHEDKIALQITELLHGIYNVREARAD